MKLNETKFFRILASFKRLIYSLSLTSHFLCYAISLLKMVIFYSPKLIRGKWFTTTTFLWIQKRMISELSRSVQHFYSPKKKTFKHVPLSMKRRINNYFKTFLICDATSRHNLLEQLSIAQTEVLTSTATVYIAKTKRNTAVSNEPLQWRIPKKIKCW